MPLPGGLNQVAIEGSRDAVLLVRRHERVPESLGNDTEEGSAVPPIDPGAQEFDT